MPRRIENAINSKLKGHAKKNALELSAHIRAKGFTILEQDEKEEGPWNGFTVSDLGYVIVSGTDDFPGPWTMWIGADNLGKYSQAPITEDIKEFAWKHVSPCGSCGGDCSPGVRTTVFGKDFENTCQANMIFVNPDAKAVEYMKKIVDIKGAVTSKTP
ncbi:MAG: hypothetical protein FWC73_11980 [Defluviitaleaceae bacterium]|nr:hypothetical protein [Defluviitaleaceae bacterium]